MISFLIPLLGFIIQLILLNQPSYLETIVSNLSTNTTIELIQSGYIPISIRDHDNASLLHASLKHKLNDLNKFLFKNQSFSLFDVDLNG
jgi:hypothetical protein